MLREEGGGGVQEGNRVTCVEMDGVWYVVLHCDGNGLCFQVGNKLRSWFVLVPYSKEYV